MTVLETAPPEASQAVTQAAEIMFRGGCSAWSTIAGAACAYAGEGEAIQGRPAELLASLGPALITRLSWSGDRQGPVWLAVSESCVKDVVARMMALMTGDVPDIAGTQLDTDSLDAYVEAGNNFAGQGGQALRDALGGAHRLAVEKTIRSGDLAQGESGLPDEPVLAAAGSLSFDGTDSHKVLLVVGASCLPQPAAPDGDGGAEEGGAEAAGDDSLVEVGGEVFSAENMAHVMRIPVPFIVILTEKKMRMELIQEMAPGTILEFRKQSGEILDVCANQVKIAEAEVVTTNQHFGVQIRRMLTSRGAPPAGEAN